MNHKSLYIIFITLQIALFGNSQSMISDHLEWNMIIKDALGNVDSLIFGSHPLAKANDLVDQLGERASIISNSNALSFVINKSTGLFTKKSFGLYNKIDGIDYFYMDSSLINPFSNIRNFPIIILGNAHYFPLTITLIQTVFDSNLPSYFRLIPFQILVGEYNQPKKIIQINHNTQYDTLSIQYNVAFTVERSDVTFRSDSTIPLFVTFTNAITPYHEIPAEYIKIYPNPAIQYLHIFSDENVLLESYKIYNTNGVLMLADSKNFHTIDVTSFPSGVYSIFLWSKTGKYSVKKFVVYR